MAVLYQQSLMSLCVWHVLQCTSLNTEFSLDKAVTFQEPNEPNGIELTKDEDQLLEPPEPEDAPLDMEQEEAVKLERKWAETDDGEDNALQQGDDEEQTTVQSNKILKSEVSVKLIINGVYRVQIPKQVWIHTDVR